MRETREPITETIRGRRITVCGIRHWHCDECGDDWFTADEADALGKAQLAELRRFEKREHG